MTRKKTVEIPDSKYDKSIAEKEYGYAISLMQYATELLWQQFGVFMLTETIIVGYLGNALIKNDKFLFEENGFVFVGSILGLFICILWYSTFEYNHSFYLLRMEQAKRHEKVLGFSLFTEGKKRSDDNKVLHGFRPHSALIYLIGLFGIMFAILIFFTRPYQ